MNHHFNCQTFSGNPLIEPLVFDWDEEAGTVSGPGAAEILRWVAAGGVPMHPAPASHTFSADPLKNRTDMAAILGLLHRLPPDLQGAYPQLVDEGGEEDPDYEFGGPVASDDPALLDPTPREVIY